MTLLMINFLQTGKTADSFSSGTLIMRRRTEAKIHSNGRIPTDCSATYPQIAYSEIIQRVSQEVHIPHVRSHVLEGISDQEERKTFGITFFEYNKTADFGAMSPKSLKNPTILQRNDPTFPVESRPTLGKTSGSSLRQLKSQHSRHDNTNHPCQKQE